MAIEIHWIRDDQTLAEHCQSWRELPFVALDTEFMRVDTFYPKAGLIQVGVGEHAYLIDPLLIGDWQPLADLLDDTAVVKVLHACSEDLEVLLRLTGKLPQPLFDTQLAAGYLNIGFSMGYSRLVQEVLGLDLPKGETRSDWLQRPLSDTQVSYAAEDAVHLAELFSALRPKLSDDKYAWSSTMAPSWSPRCAVKSSQRPCTATSSWPGSWALSSWLCCASCVPGASAKPAAAMYRATVSSRNTRCGPWPRANPATCRPWARSKRCTRAPSARTASSSSS